MYDLSNGSVSSDLLMAMYSTYMLHSRFQGHGVIFRPINALDVLCVQLTRDLFAIAKFLFEIRVMKQSLTARHKKTVSLMQCRFFFILDVIIALTPPPVPMCPLLAEPPSPRLCGHHKRIVPFVNFTHFITYM